MSKMYFVFMQNRIVLICLFLAMSLYAHPHIFVTASVSIDFKSSGEMTIKNKWIFDELYSVAQFDFVDEDKDGILSKEERHGIERFVLGSTQRYNYYNYLQLGSQFIASQDGYKNFEIKKEGKFLVVTFDLIFNLELQKDYTVFTYVLKDLANYYQIDIDMEKITVQAPPNIEVEYFIDSIEGLTLFRAFPPSTEGLFLRFKEKGQ